MTTQSQRYAWASAVRRYTTAGNPVCIDKIATVTVLAAGPTYPAGYIKLHVHPAAVLAFQSLAAVLHHHNYPFRESAGGSWVCRNITGASASAIRRQAELQQPLATSLHAHGIAGDWNPSKNGYRRAVGPIQWGRHTDMTPAMIADVEAIRTSSGLAVWSWGGRWSNTKDPMHFEIKRTPNQLGEGLARHTVAGWARYAQWLAALNHQPTPPIGESMLVPGDTGPLVKFYQRALRLWGASAPTPFDPLPRFGVDGVWGRNPDSEMTAAVMLYRRAAGRPDEASIDSTIAGALARYVTLDEVRRLLDEFDGTPGETFRYILETAHPIQPLEA